MLESFCPPPSWMMGRSASTGCERTRFIRPITSTSADCMSVPMAKVRLMKLPPELALPSISSTPGRPCRTSSCGSSSSASVSSGDAARQPVKIEIFGRSMSGKSCRGRRPRLMDPNRQIRSTTTPTAIGLRIDALISRMTCTPKCGQHAPVGFLLGCGKGHDGYFRHACGASLQRPVRIARNLGIAAAPFLFSDTGVTRSISWVATIASLVRICCFDMLLRTFRRPRAHMAEAGFGQGPSTSFSVC